LCLGSKHRLFQSKGRSYHPSSTNFCVLTFDQNCFVQKHPLCHVRSFKPSSIIDSAKVQTSWHRVVGDRCWPQIVLTYPVKVQAAESRRISVCKGQH
jgi:hypothetical protein